MTWNHTTLEITEWIGSFGTRYLCTLFTDNGKVHDFREIPIDEARVIQWELLKKGAKKITSYNPYAPHIFTRQIRLLEIKGMW